MEELLKNNKLKSKRKYLINFKNWYKMEKVILKERGIYTNEKLVWHYMGKQKDRTRK